MSELDDIRKRDADSGALWFTGPASFTAQAARDRRALLAKLDEVQAERDRFQDVLLAWVTARLNEQYAESQGQFVRQREWQVLVSAAEVAAQKLVRPAGLER